MAKEKKTDVGKEITRQREITMSPLRTWNGFELNIGRPLGKGWELISAVVAKGENGRAIVWTWERKR
jgi:hypothetical protein